MQTASDVGTIFLGVLNWLGARGGMIPSPLLLFHSLPSLFLRSRPSGGSGERRKPPEHCKLPSGVWGGSSAEVEFDAF